MKNCNNVVILVTEAIEWFQLSIIKLLKAFQIVYTCSSYHNVIFIIKFNFAGSQTMSTDDPPTTPTAIESTDATTSDATMATAIKTNATTAAMATTIEPNATTIVSRGTATQSNIGLLVGVTVLSASFVVVVAISFVVVGVLLRVIKKGQGSKTSSSGPQVHFHNEGKDKQLSLLLRSYISSMKFNKISFPEDDQSIWSKRRKLSSYQVESREPCNLSSSTELN